MVLKGIHLFFIMVAFLLLIGGFVIFIYRHKFTVASRLAKELGFTAYLGSENVPTEMVSLGQGIREFREFEWVLAGEVNGQKVYIAQYFLDRRTLYMYRFVVFSPFLQKREEVIPKEEDLSLTQNGVYFYKAIPWTLKKETVWPVVEKVVQAHIFTIKGL